jgi:hypothetical protein
MGCNPSREEEIINEYYESILITRKHAIDYVKELKEVVLSKNYNQDEILEYVEKKYFSEDKFECKVIISSFYATFKSETLNYYDILVFTVFLCNDTTENKYLAILDLDSIFNNKSIFIESNDKVHIISFGKLKELLIAYVEFVTLHSLIRLHGAEAQKDDSFVKLACKFDVDGRENYVHSKFLNNLNKEILLKAFLIEKEKYLNHITIRDTLISETIPILNSVPIEKTKRDDFTV